MSVYSESGHLEYYIAHGISPVHYDISNFQSHLERRASLYRSLGLTHLCIKGSAVLEIAPGSGFNSLYIATCAPGSFELVEPNPQGQTEIASLYAQFERPHTQPRLYTQRLQEFNPGRTFDVVICENWLGQLPSERQLMRKLASLTSPGGILVVTVVPVSGFLPNVLRKLMADRLVDDGANFEQKAGLLLSAFSPHLSTIAAMTRPHRDWVHDCMLNPHYLNVCLPLGTVLEDLGDEMDALGSNPVFHVDWRWFKGMHGEARQFNRAFYDSYLANVHNFIDYRAGLPPRTAADNQAIETLCLDLHALAIQAERARGDDLAGWRSQLDEISAGVRRLADLLAPLSTELAQAFGEAAEMLVRPSLSAADVAGMGAFAGLFGRETVYVSWERRGVL